MEGAGEGENGPSEGIRAATGAPSREGNGGGE